MYTSHLYNDTPATPAVGPRQRLASYEISRRLPDSSQPASTRRLSAGVYPTALGASFGWLVVVVVVMVNMKTEVDCVSLRHLFTFLHNFNQTLHRNRCLDVNFNFYMIDFCHVSKFYKITFNPTCAAVLFDTSFLVKFS